MQTARNGTQEAEKASTSTNPTTPGTSSVDFVAVPAAKADRFWPLVRDHIWPAFEQFSGETTEQRVFSDIQDGKTQLWVAWRDGVLGGALTQIITYPEFCAIRVLALGGEDFETWRGTADSWFQRFGEHHGASRVEFFGRKGWERRLPNWTVNRIMMTREIV